MAHLYFGTLRYLYPHAVEDADEGNQIEDVVQA